MEHDEHRKRRRLDSWTRSQDSEGEKCEGSRGPLQERSIGAIGPMRANHITPSLSDETSDGYIDLNPV